MQETILHKDAFRHVESELYAYPNRKREIDRLRLEVLSPFDEDPEDKTVVKGKNSVRNPGDPTGRTAVALASSARLVHLEQVKYAIDEVYNNLPEARQELIRLKYWTKPQRLTTLGICDNLRISESTFRRWRRKFIHDIAEILGW
jgi:RinA family phage transcriptional activator